MERIARWVGERSDMNAFTRRAESLRDGPLPSIAPTGSFEPRCHRQGPARWTTFSRTGAQAPLYLEQFSPDVKVLAPA